MKHYVFSRLLQLIPILFVITFLSFAMMRLAGSDVVLQSMERTGMAASDAVVAAARAELGLDKPFLTQYFTWLGKLLQGDMGRSYVSGRPVFETFIAKLPATLLLTGVSVGLTLLVSLPLGIFLAVNQNRWGDWVIRSLSFVGNSIPNFFAALLNGGLVNAVFALAAISWPKYARIARSQTLRLKDSDFLAAAKMSGATTAAQIWRHILPNAMGPILVTAMLDIGTMMMELAGLSFLGLGAQPPTAELGNMMSGGRSMLQTYPWVILAPGAAILFAVVAFNLLGDAVRDRLDPKNTQR